MQQLTKNTELLTLINNCSAACSCNNCSNSTEEGSVVGNDDMPMDDDIDEQEDYNTSITGMKYFQFSVFQDMFCMILCSNSVLDATCHKHIFYCDSLSHFLCSTCIKQAFGNLLALHVLFCNNCNSVAIDWPYLYFFLYFFFFTSIFSFSCRLSRSGEPLDQDFVPCRHWYNVLFFFSILCFSLCCFLLKLC